MQRSTRQSCWQGFHIRIGPFLLLPLCFCFNLSSSGTVLALHLCFVLRNPTMTICRNSFGVERQVQHHFHFHLLRHLLGGRPHSHPRFYLIQLLLIIVFFPTARANRDVRESEVTASSYSAFVVLFFPPLISCVSLDHSGTVLREAYLEGAIGGAPNISANDLPYLKVRTKPLKKKNDLESGETTFKQHLFSE